MKLNVTAERDNPVLQRKEITVALDFEGGATPKVQELAAAIAKSRGCDAALVEITKLSTSSGRAAGTAAAKVWNSAEVKEKFKAHKRKKQSKPAEGAAEAAAPAKK